jgi:type IV pilus assembly protein PilB
MTQTAQNGTGQKTLVDALFASGKITAADVEKVKIDAVQTGKSQEAILLAMGLSPLEIIKAKSAYYNIEYVNLSNIPISPEALSLISRDVAKRLSVFPISIDKAARVLRLAMANPLDVNTIEFVEKKTGFKVVPLWADGNEIGEFISVKYSTSINKEVTEAVAEVDEEVAGKLRDTITNTGFIKDEKIAEIVSHILEFAIRGRASDIHIEPQENVTRVRYRIDGILWEKLTIPRALHEALVSRIKILSGMKIDEKRVPQDGRFAFNALNEEIDLRVSSLPTTWGEKIVMRLLKKTGGIPDVVELGLRGSALKTLNDAVLRPHYFSLWTNW